MKRMFFIFLMLCGIVSAVDYQLQSGETDVTLSIPLYDSTNGSLKTGVTIANLDIYYIRTETDNDVTLSSKVDITALTGLTDAHTDNYGYEVGLGYYRFDFPDAIFAAGATTASIYIADATGNTILPATIEIQLTAQNPYDKADVGYWLGTACATPTVAGVPETDMTHISGEPTTVSTTTTTDLIAGDYTVSFDDETYCDIGDYVVFGTGVLTSHIGVLTDKTVGGWTFHPPVSGSFDSATIATVINLKSIWSTQAYSLSTQAKADVQAEVEAADLSSSTVGTVNALASAGLDGISTTEPDGRATTFREMIVQLYQRFFNKATSSNTELKVYKDDGTTVNTTQTVSKTGTTQTIGEAE